jgi:archaellum component FlaF (FlaF/FlaG flagellin family)
MKKGDKKRKTFVLLLPFYKRTTALKTSVFKAVAVLYLTMKNENTEVKTAKSLKNRRSQGCLQFYTGTTSVFINSLPENHGSMMIIFPSGVVILKVA